MEGMEAMLALLDRRFDGTLDDALASLDGELQPQTVGETTAVQATKDTRDIWPPLSAAGPPAWRPWPPVRRVIMRARAGPDLWLAFDAADWARDEAGEAH
ncbi:MAG: hypothetical protein K6T75_08190 [Acetobacteraceae bacterium]|nr:hypothetical protein [Acetobacteraceae bacterium]